MEIKPEMFDEMKPCAEGITWLKSCKTKTPAGLLKSAGMNSEKLEYLNWGIARLLSRENKIRYAIFSARQVLHIFEEKFPTDKRPRLAIEAAEKYLESPTRAAAEAAARAAAEAAARAAAWAAVAAAEAAAWDAAWAAGAAAEAAVKIKILKHGIELLEKQGVK